MSTIRDQAVPTNSVVVSGVTKLYGATKALAGVDVAFRRGVVTAVVGANGSGKTTLLRVVSGLLDPSSGRVEGPTGQIGRAHV